MLVTMDDIDPASELRVYPNPAKVGQSITMEGLSSQIYYQYTLLNTTGQTMRHVTISDG